MTLEQARALVFPEAQQFTAVPLALKPAEARRVRELTGLPLASPAFKVWRVQSGNRMLGWYFVHQVIGKRKYLTFAAGITPEGAFKHIEIVRSMQRILAVAERVRDKG